eukprot:3399324-Prymnesium_polylepis.1
MKTLHFIRAAIRAHSIHSLVFMHSHARWPRTAATQHGTCTILERAQQPLRARRPRCAPDIAALAEMRCTWWGDTP